uniref:Uncharacterized protein n=1 Tax=Rousettus aegyptiacus TaxID=9407 RepID=A0A7J8JI50_ROUAE|nr:hypothetical protein HJG63_010274 [Rousettus aegyptiacus]
MMGGCAYLAKCFLQKEIFPSCFCRDETKFNHLGLHTQYNFLQCIIQVGVAHHPFLGPGLVGSLLNIKGLCGNFLQLSQLILHLKLLGLCQKDGLFICFLSSISLLSFLLYIHTGDSFDFSVLCVPDFSWSEIQTLFKKEK